MASSSSRGHGRRGLHKSVMIEANILKDGFVPDEEMEFVELLCEAVDKLHMRDNPLKVAACLKAIGLQMGPAWKKAYSFNTLQRKLEQLRTRNIMFKKWRMLPGVDYNIRLQQASVEDYYFANFQNEHEPPLYEFFRGDPCLVEKKLPFIFDVHGVAQLPADIIGSHDCPIDVDGDTINIAKLARAIHMKEINNPAVRESNDDVEMVDEDDDNVDDDYVHVALQGLAVDVPAVSKLGPNTDDEELVDAAMLFVECKNYLSSFEGMGALKKDK